jgi:cytidine deaminase
MLDQLFTLAAATRQRAHAPYSRFLVGAAIEASDGSLHAGCNVENIAYPQGQCAEAGAIGAMVAAGQRCIRRIVILGGPEATGLIRCAPCGGCRQRIAEFADAGTEVWFGASRESLQCHAMTDLLPGAFDSLS